MELPQEGQPKRRRSILKSRNSITSIDQTEDINIPPKSPAVVKRRVSFSSQQPQIKLTTNVMNTTQFGNNSVYMDITNATNFTMVEGDPIFSTTTRFNDVMDTTHVQNSMLDQTSFYDELMNELTVGSIMQANTTINVRNDEDDTIQENELTTEGSMMQSNTTMINVKDVEEDTTQENELTEASMMQASATATMNVMDEEDDDSTQESSVEEIETILGNKFSGLDLPKPVHLQPSKLSFGNFANPRTPRRPPRFNPLPLSMLSVDVQTSPVIFGKLDDNTTFKDKPMEISVRSDAAAVAIPNSSSKSTNKSMAEVEILRLPNTTYLQEKTMTSSFSFQNPMENIHDNNKAPSEIKIPSKQMAKDTTLTCNSKDESMQLSTVGSRAAAAIPIIPTAHQSIKEIENLPNPSFIEEKTMMISNASSQNRIDNIRNNNKTPSEIKIPSKQPSEELMAKVTTSCKSKDESMQLSVAGSRATATNPNLSSKSGNKSMEMGILRIPSTTHIQEKTSASVQNPMETFHKAPPVQLKEFCEELMPKDATCKNKNASIQRSVVGSRAAPAAIPNLSSKPGNKSMEILHLPDTTYIQEKSMITSFQNPMETFHKRTPAQLKESCEELKLMGADTTRKNKDESQSMEVSIGSRAAAAAAIHNLSNKSLAEKETTNIQEKTMIASFQNPKGAPAAQLKESCEELNGIDTTYKNKDECQSMEVSIGSRAAAIPNSSFKSPHEKLPRTELSPFTHHYIKNFKSFHGIQMVNALQQIELELKERGVDFDKFIKKYGFAFSSKWIEMIKKKIEFWKSMEKEIQETNQNQGC